MTVPNGARTSLSGSERLVVVGGFGLAVVSLVPWYEPTQFAFDASRTNGWQDPDALLSQAATVLGTLVAVATIVGARQTPRPRLGSLSWGTALTAASAVTFGLVALKFALNLDGTTVGVYLALLASVTQLYGAYVTRVTEEAAPAAPAPGSPPGPAAPAAGAPSIPAAPAAPASGALAAAWPETSYLLAQWLRPGTDPTAALAGYQARFGGVPGRRARLVAELRSLLDPARGEEERTRVVAANAPHLAGSGGRAVLGWLAHALEPPPPPDPPRPPAPAPAP